uniref:Secreted protein n=1 Tax=Globodera pallida TaxID=36090 RepID=A0A183CRN3_GLOPA
MQIFMLFLFALITPCAFCGANGNEKPIKNGEKKSQEADNYVAVVVDTAVVDTVVVDTVLVEKAVAVDAPYHMSRQ